MKSLKAIYPGTFDLFTFGHADIVTRGLCLFESIVIAVAPNASKKTFFTLKERVRLVHQALDEMKIEKDRVTVKPFSCLLVDFAASENAHVLIRGLRSVSDFDYEFQLALTNQKLKNGIETIFLMASDQRQFISSGLVKEVARWGGDISDFAPKTIVQAVQHYLQSNGAA